MTGVGRAVLIVALLTATYSVVAALYGARTGQGRWTASSRRAIYAVAGLTTIAVVIVEVAFVTNDFSFGLVTDNSSTTTPMFYKLTAMWSSQSGSLLLWIWVLSIFASIALVATHRRHREIAPYATAILGGLAAFFAFLLVFKVSPFTSIATPPAEGAGLNPLLRHPSMMFHPPMLYSGYVGFSIPFAFAVGALIARRVDAEWIRSTRKFALIAWTFLSIGILLGARWSYSELGWGGYWGWDPVENASLMPWLVGTAYIHSMIVQEKRDMLKIWNVSLITATFALALLGTFLVRSGILNSIHAFGESTVGVYFLALIAIVALGTTALIVSRLDDLRTDRRIDSLLSREAVFLINNLLFVGLCFVVFWGTFFPLISEAVTGTKASVGPPWFDRYTVPLAIGLVLMSGIGPLLAWRRVTAARFAQIVAVPVAIAAAGTLTLLVVTDLGDSIGSVLLVCFAIFTLVAVAGEFVRGVRARRAMSSGGYGRALVAMVGRNRRRYGGYIVHAGIAILMLGIAVSSAFNTQRDLTLRPGEKARVGGYEMRYTKPTSSFSSEKLDFGAVVDVSKDGKHVATLRPKRSYFPSSNASMGVVSRYFGGESTTEVGLSSDLRRDIWAAVQPDLSALDGPIRKANRRFADSPPRVQGFIIATLAELYPTKTPPATFRVIVNPMVTWIWVGGLIIFAGALIALWPASRPARQRVTSAYAARLGRELSKA